MTLLGLADFGIMAVDGGTERQFDEVAYKA